ncbi:DMT family transporter [Shewanella marina]|uniref:DMT family transporter n=1 Tax=Shewanella marina TaxID=487319 RepID=UPI00046E5844|nr:DMT family transporter [Shewanella marina]
MQQSSERLGLFFISVAVIFWGILPIALKLSGGFIDAITLTWFRFAVALVVSFFIQLAFGQLHQFKQLTRQAWLKLGLAGVVLISNYVSFVIALKYLAPGTAQLNFQTAPFFLAFGGMLFFKEKLSAFQLTCFATLALGMLLFFHPYLHFSREGGSSILIGVMIIQFSAMSWASYALLQKSLLTQLSPNNVLLFIYAFGIVAMAPFSHFEHFTHMNSGDWSIAIFCAINTLVAYGCFGQAMRYWPTAQVSAMVPLTPLFSFALTAWVSSMGWWSDIIHHNSIDALSMFGIALIISSVMLMQLLPLYRARRRFAATI